MPFKEGKTACLIDSLSGAMSELHDLNIRVVRFKNIIIYLVGFPFKCETIHSRV